MWVNPFLNATDAFVAAWLPGSEGAGVADILFGAGKPGSGRRLLLGPPGALSTNPGPELIVASAADRTAQEDSVRLRWMGAGRAVAAIAGDAPADFSRQANGDLALELELKVNAAPTADVSLLMGCGANCSGGFPIRSLLAEAAKSGKWTRIAVPLRCFEKAGVDMKRVDTPLSFATAGGLDITLSTARIVSPVGPQLACK